MLLLVAFISDSLVETLCVWITIRRFAVAGTLIASGSDDLKVVILDWIRSKTYISFESGHRANVFQVVSVLE